MKTVGDEGALLVNITKKAVPPEDTVKSLQDKLDELGLKYTLLEAESVANIHSCAITLDDFPHMKSFGKGLTRSYSQASAFAELFENMQTTFMIKEAPEHHLISVYDDATYINSALSPVQADFLDKSFGSPTWRQLNDFICVPFLNARTGTTEYVPTDIVYYACITNGLCAGNTENEAIIQGICEIYERHILKQIYTRKATAMLLPKYVEIELPVYDSIRSLRDRGYQVDLLDFSDNGVWPVAGIIVSKGNKNTLCLGSAPHFHVAFERCMTEIFQGVESLDWLDTHMLKEIVNMNDLNSQELNRIYDKALQIGWGIDPSFLVYTKSNADVVGITSFRDNNFTTTDTLQRMLKIAWDHGHNVYLREYSYLGFCTIKIYVPGMSEVYMLTKEVLEAQKEVRRKLSQVKSITCLHDNTTFTTLVDLYRYAAQQYNEEHIYLAFVHPKDAPVKQNDSKYSNMVIFLSWLAVELGHYHDAKKLLADNIAIQLKTGVFASLDICLKLKKDIAQIEAGRRSEVRVYDSISNYYADVFASYDFMPITKSDSASLAVIQSKIANYAFNSRVASHATALAYY